MKKHSFLLILSSLIGTIAFGQTKVTLYYNSAVEITNQDKSSFRREAFLNLENIVFHGSFKDYNKQGDLIGEGSYNNGVQSGHYRIYSNSNLITDIVYLQNSFVIWEYITQDEVSEVNKGTGKFSLDFVYYETYYEIRNWKTGTLVGEFNNGNKVGKWVYESHDKKRKYEEIYRDGKFIERLGYGKYGEDKFDSPLEITPLFYSTNAERFNYDNEVYTNLYRFFEQYPPVDDSLQRNISYPGGIANLIKDIQRNLDYPLEDRLTETQGRVIINITIDEHGIVKSKQVLKSVSKTLDKEAIRVIELFEGKLCPASLNGKAYESTIAIPIVFRLG